MSNINLNVVGTGNFTQIEGAIKHLQSSIAQLNAQAGTAGAFGTLSKNLNAQIAQVHALAEAQGLMKVHTTSLATEADRLTTRISKGKTTFQDFKGALRGVTKEGSVYMEMARKQLAIQNMSAVQIGKNIYGYENLGRAELTAAEAAMANAKAISAQNAVLRQSMVHVVNWGKNMQWTGRQLTMGLTMPLVMFGAAAAKTFNDVDKNLTKLAKVYGVGLMKPTEAALAGIRKEIIALSIDLGKTLGIAANEVTDIAAQFAAAGMQGEQLVYATKQAARMVVLGEADKQEAINATISLQTAYRLNTSELTEAVNFFNAAQAATSTNMADLINAVPRVGPIIKQLGGTYKDMVAIITALKEGGVPAGEAANAIKNSLGRIINPTKTAREELMKFGIDIQGIVNKNAGNLTGTLFELQNGLMKLDGLSRQRAISELFGKYQFARMSAFIENFGKVGSQSQKIMEMMGMSAAQLAGIADEQTKKIQQSASGKFKIAVESLKNSLLPIGESALKTFATVLEKVTKFIETMENLPGPIKTAVKTLLLLGGVVGPLTMIAGLMGNLFGTVGMGIVKLKTVGGAIGTFASTRDIAATKAVLGGFRQLDPAVISASKAYDLLKEKEITAAEASGRFTTMIERMTEALLELQSTSGIAGANVAKSMEQIAMAAGTASSSGLFSTSAVFSALSRSKGVQNVSQQHYLPANFLAKELGISNKQARQYSGFIRQMPPQFDILQSAVGQTPLLYGGKFGGREAIENTIFQNSMNASYKKDSLPKSMTMHEWTQFSKEASVRLPVSIEAVAKEYGTLFATINAGGANISKQLNKELSAIRKTGVEGEELLAQSTEVVQRLFRENSQAQAQHIQLQASYEQRILEAWNSASTIEQAQVNVAHAIQAIEDAAMAERGNLNRISITQLSLANAFNAGTYSVNGQSVQGILEAVELTSEKFKEIHIAATAKLEEMSSALNMVKEGIASTPLPQKPGIMASRADKRAYQTYTNVQIPEAEQKLATATNSLAQLRATLAEKMAVAAELENNYQKQLKASTTADAKLAAAKERLTAAEEAKNKISFKSGARLEAANAELAAAEEEYAKAEKRATLAQNRLNGTTVRLDELRNGEVLDAERLRVAEEELAMADAMLTEIREASAAVNPGMGRGKVMAGISGLTMLSMMPMMMGFNNALTETISQLGMLTMGIMMLESVLGTALFPVMAIVASLFLAYKAFSMYNDAVKKNAQAITGMLTVSNTEAESLGITVRKIGDIPIKRLGDNATATSDAINKLAESFKNLAEDDSLKQFIESLKDAAKEDKNKNWNERRLQQKYLEYRAAGATEKAAETQVLAIAQASGLGLTGQEAMRKMKSKTDNYTLQDFMVEAQKQGYNALPGDVKKEFASGAYLGKEGLAAVSANAQSLYSDIITTQGPQALKLLKQIDKEMSKTPETAQYYQASINSMFSQMGEGAEQTLKTMKTMGYAAKDEMLGAKLVIDGFVGSWEELQTLAKDPVKFEIVVNQMLKKEALDQAANDFINGASKGITNTNTAKAKAAQTTVDAQQKIVDKLQKELDTRKKILEAQDKQLSHANSMMNLQQQYNEAMFSGDMAKAAELQRTMTQEQVKYNQELQTSAMENNLQKEQDKLDTLKKTSDAMSKLTTTTKKTNDKLTEFKDVIEKTLLGQNGPATAAQIKNWTDKLVAMGIPVKEAGPLVKNLVAQFSSNVDTTMTSDMINHLKGLEDEQKKALFTSLLLKNVNSGKYATDMEAAAAAYNMADVGNGKAVVAGTVNGVEGLYTTTGSGASRKSTLVWKPVGGFTPDANNYKVPIGNRTIPSPPNVNSGVYFNKASGAWETPSTPEITMNPSQYIKSTTWKKGMKYSHGGLINGRGSWTSDSIPAMVSNGEYVVNAAAVSKVGTGFMDQLNKLGYANSAPLMSIISATGSSVIPVQIVPSSNSSSLYNDHSSVNVYVTQTNASASDIANAVYGAIQRRDNMTSAKMVV